MKRRNQATMIIALMLAILTISCTASRKNEVIYRYSPMEDALPFDSLRSEIVAVPGIEMLVVYPDSDVVIIHYDRFKSHQTLIESRFSECGYNISLIKKSRIEEKDQPWEKR